jgi:hypothetical protein
MSINMRPGQVAAAGDDLRTLADEAKQKLRSLFHLSDVAAQANPGWLAAASLTNCRTVWEQRMRETVDSTAELGEALTVSAGDAANADAAGAGRLTTVLDTFGT